MPPKSKLIKNTGKEKCLLKRNEIESRDSNLMTSGLQLTPEAEQQFELELCWCIQQLQIALKNGKLNSKQIQDHTKALNSLMSNSTPIIKKRQIMRLSFGDYRAKMAQENKKHALTNAKIKITPTKPNKKSIFIKKSILNNGGEYFKFNFNVPKEDCEQANQLRTEKMTVNAITEDVSSMNLAQASVNDEFHFIPSGNMFMFNFDIKS